MSPVEQNRQILKIQKGVKFLKFKGDDNSSIFSKNIFHVGYRVANTRLTS